MMKLLCGLLVLVYQAGTAQRIFSGEVNNGKLLSAIGNNCNHRDKVDEKPITKIKPALPVRTNRFRKKQVLVISPIFILPKH